MPPRTSKDIDRAWADSFTSLLSQPSQPSGPGWKTIDQIKKDFSIGWGRAYKLVRKQLKEGHLEKFKGQQRIGKRLCGQTWYRPVALQGVKSR